MNPSEILEIIKAFFDALRNILKAMGIMKDKEEEEQTTAA